MWGKPLRSLVLTGAALAAIAAVDIWQVVRAVDRRASSDLVVALAASSILLLSSSSFCLFSALAGFLRQRWPEREPVAVYVALGGEYVARYSRATLIMALLLTGFFAGMTIMLLLRSKRWDLIIFVASLFVGNLFYAIHIGTTRVKFTHTGFEAQLSWFRELHEPYRSGAAHKWKTADTHHSFFRRALAQTSLRLGRSGYNHFAPGSSLPGVCRAGPGLTGLPPTLPSSSRIKSRTSDLT
jgi:hypothetical protein